MTNESEITIFVGPTAFGIEDRLMPHRAKITVRPPARRGDIDALVSSNTPVRRVAIVDGTFHNFPSIGHAEIRNAIETGWEIWGLSSMGAIRALEMRRFGVRGFGQVYQTYMRTPDFDDDEVALLHEAEAPYRPLSEPLIHVRFFLSCLVAQRLISAESSLAILNAFKRRWYAERTLADLRQLLPKIGGLSDELACQKISEFGKFRIKSIDLVKFLEERPWRDETS